MKYKEYKEYWKSKKGEKYYKDGQFGIDACIDAIKLDLKYDTIENIYKKLKYRKDNEMCFNHYMVIACEILIQQEAQKILDLIK